MTPDQFIQAIEPWIEIANTVITLYWAVVILPALGCSAAVYAVIAGERWIDGDKRGIDRGGFSGKRIADLSKIHPPRGPSGVQRRQDRPCVVGGQLRASLPLRPWGPGEPPRMDPSLEIPRTIRG